VPGSAPGAPGAEPLAAALRVGYDAASPMRTLVQAIVRGLAARKARWESICTQCGLCCYEKDIRGGRVIVRMDSPCRYLDVKTRLCRVYDRRFRVCAECRKMRRFHARFSRWLPQTCGYVRAYRRPVPPRQ
jgi:uncharacterized protein